MLRDKLIAAIRTGCATLGALVITATLGWLANVGLEVEYDSSWGVALSFALFSVLVAFYNFAVAWLTDNVWGGFGWLLGVNKPPSYITDNVGDLLSPYDQQVATTDTDPSTVEWVDEGSPHGAR